MKHIIFETKKIGYRTAGKGKPVILLHGFAEDSAIWKHQEEKLKADFYIILIDLPGSGQSEMLNGSATIDDYADAVKAIADAECSHNGFMSFTVIGHSMGGYIALAFAEKYPPLVNALGLFHSTAYADDEAKKETRKKGIDFIKNNGTALFLKTTIPNLFSDKTKNNDTSLIEKVLDDYKNFSTESLIQYYQAMIKKPDRTGVLKNICKPVLFVAGSNDKAVPLHTLLEQCYLPPVAYIFILQNSAHMGMLEEPDVSNGLLAKFLSEIPL